MAGHSKWANIQHRKGAQDARRGKVFTKLIREITIASRLGGPEPKDNPRLRAAIDKALDNNMTRDTIERAVKRGAGALEGESLEEIRYEGYGAGGAAVMVDCMTDNRMRTVAEVRHAFTKCGGNMGTDGSVAYLFSKVGMLGYAPPADEDRILEVALEAGAQDVITHEDGFVEVLTAPEEFSNVKTAMVAAGLVPSQSEITEKASINTELEDEDAKKMVKLLDMLEDLDDVQNVYSNAAISDEAVADLS